MNKNIKAIDESTRIINWEEVEYKISIIRRRFDNIEPRYKDDLAQELRIHAYYVSDNYYDLYRKAIDYWRSLQVRVYPEVPFFDLEILGRSETDKEVSVIYDEIVSKVLKELNRSGESAYDNRTLEIAKEIFTIITTDIENPKDAMNISCVEYVKNRYTGPKINLSWLSEELNVSYKAVSAAMREIESIIRGLAEMGKIEVDDKYKKPL